MKKDTCVIIPAYNEGTVILKTLKDVIKAFPFVVCVDDGSKDNTANMILKSKAVLIRHPLNMGQGAALQTGIEYALQFPKVKYFVTFDADGQHDILDAQKMVERLRSGKFDIVLGSRFLGSAVGMPVLKKVMLRAAIYFTNFVSQVKLTDTHNGIRAFNRKFATNLNITMTGMAHASEIVDRVGKGQWKYEEAPVTISYTEYSRAKGQSILNSVNISMDLLLNRSKR